MFIRGSLQIWSEDFVTNALSSLFGRFNERGMSGSFKDWLETFWVLSFSNFFPQKNKDHFFLIDDIVAT